MITKLKAAWKEEFRAGMCEYLSYKAVKNCRPPKMPKELEAADIDTISREAFERGKRYGQDTAELYEEMDQMWD